MRIEDQGNHDAFASARLIAAIRAADAAVTPASPATRTASDICDPAELARCRLRLAEAAQEIDRLRQERPDVVFLQEPSPPQAEEPDRPEPSSYEPRAYAPPPLGQPSELRPEPPLDDGFEPFVNYFHVTNLGTLLDMLA